MDSQRKAARIVGAAYLFAIIPAVFAEFYTAGLIDPHSAAATASHIVAHERLFRLGVASNLLVFATDVVLIAALYVVLKPINWGLALLAVFWRLVETALLVTALTNDMQVLRLLSGAAYLTAIPPDEASALARLALSGHGATYNFGLFFAGLGSTAFAWLWLRSGYIPRPLAALGVLASAILATCVFAFVIFPELQQTLTVIWYAGPIFIFEVSIGFWLLLRPIRLDVQDTATNTIKEA